MDLLQNKGAVIFDFDGTLYNKKNIALKLILSSPFQMLRMKAERTARKHFKGKYFGSGDEFFRAFYNELSLLTNMSPEKACKWYKNFYLPQMVKILKKHYCAYEGVEQIFKGLRRDNIKIAVFSDYSFVSQKMEAIGLDTSLVDIIQNAEDCGGLKPASKPFLALAKELQVEPQNILVVGDRDDTDGEGARQSKMAFAHITQETPLATYFSQYLPS